MSLNRQDVPKARSLSKSRITHWHRRPYQWPSSGLIGPQHKRLASICKDLTYWTALFEIEMSNSTYFPLRWIYLHKLLSQRRCEIDIKSLGSNSGIYSLTLAKDMSWMVRSALSSCFSAKPWQTLLSRSTWFQNRLWSQPPAPSTYCLRQLSSIKVYV
jgi:hypothetical protein